MTFRYFRFELPFTRPVRIGNRFQSARHGVLIRAVSASGNVGWGEASPLDGYGPDTLREVVGAIEQGSEPTPSLRFGRDCAERDAASGFPLKVWFGTPRATSLENAKLITGYEEKLAGVVKTKVGADRVEDDVSRISQILNRLPAAGRLRLDANGLWDKESAHKFVSLVRQSNGFQAIEFIEEPWNGCFFDSEVASFGIPVAMDESFLGVHSPWERADVIVIKPALFGTLDETLTTTDAMQNAGKKVVLSSAFETAVGVQVLVALASQFDTVPGFGTYRYLADDIGGRQKWLDAPTIQLNCLPESPGAHLPDTAVGNLTEFGPLS